MKVPWENKRKSKIAFKERLIRHEKGFDSN